MIAIQLSDERPKSFPFFGCGVVRLIESCQRARNWHVEGGLEKSNWSQEYIGCDGGV